MTRIENPFPRTPDSLPGAWGDVEDGRFTPAYEERARRVWEATQAIGLVPEFGGAGSQDGEYLFLVHLEDPTDQKVIDTAIAKGKLETLLRRM